MGSKFKLGAAFVAAVASAALCGCSHGINIAQKLPDFDKTYTVKAEITCGELKATTDAERFFGGEWVFTFTEPKSLMGITYDITGDSFYSSLGQLDFDADKSGDFAMLPDIIATAINSLAAVTEENVSREDGVLTLTTDYNGKSVVVTAKESGELISLKCPYHGLAVYFSNQKATEPIIDDEGGLVSD